MAWCHTGAAYLYWLLAAVEGSCWPYSTFCCCMFRIWRHSAYVAPILLLFPMMLHTMFYTYHSRLHILPHLCRACRSGHSYYDTTADLTLLHHKALLHILQIQDIVWIHKGSQWKDFFFQNDDLEVTDWLSRSSNMGAIEQVLDTMKHNNKHRFWKLYCRIKAGCPVIWTYLNMVSWRLNICRLIGLCFIS